MGSNMHASGNKSLRMAIALQILRAWNHGTEGYHAGVVQAIHSWIDDGMDGPVPWPESPFFAEWAESKGYAKIDGKWVGFKFTVRLEEEVNG